MDAHGYEQEDRMIQIDVYGAAGSLPDSPSRLAALLAFSGEQAVADVADRTGGVVEGRKGWGHGAAPGEAGVDRMKPKLPPTPGTSQRLLRSVRCVAQFSSVASTGDPFYAEGQRTDLLTAIREHQADLGRHMTDSELDKFAREYYAPEYHQDLRRIMALGVADDGEGEEE
jgi:hypothetical protein